MLVNYIKSKKNTLCLMQSLQPPVTGSRTFYSLTKAVSQNSCLSNLTSICNSSGAFYCEPHYKTEVFASRFPPPLYLITLTPEVLDFSLSFFYCKLALGRSVKRCILRTVANHQVRTSFHALSLKCMSLSWIFFCVVTSGFLTF